jgi:selenocysteine-specific elongation factor
MKQYYTIGMAGHIDHGKTTLTKALTNIDTDRLREEKERSISIELGYAPIDLGDKIQASIVDVPGHERFIRQMIAGVSGIDLVILVVAADEGVMPQTKEHMEILSFLGIEYGMIAVTKIDRVDEEMLELVKDDIREEVSGTLFEKSEMFFIDSISQKGISQFKASIKGTLPTEPKRNIRAPFRLPIDQVFTIQGQGTIVRGTIVEGKVTEGERLYLLPKGVTVRSRQIQVQNHRTTEAYSGQRAALNLGGITTNEIRRGDVLTASKTLQPTTTIDVVFRSVNDIQYPLKQRTVVKLHTGTTEAMGSIIFFDRNELTEKDTDEVLCQIRLHEPISVLRGDRCIIRRPTPAETIGGGWIIDAQGQRYRFGDETVEMLTQKMESSTRERIISVLQQHTILSMEQLAKLSGVEHQAVSNEVHELQDEGIIVELGKNSLTLNDIVQWAFDELTAFLTSYHEKHSMRIGISKAELISSLQSRFPEELIEFVVEKAISSNSIEKNNHYLALPQFTPFFPAKWAKRFEGVLTELERDEINTKTLQEYFKSQQLPVDYLEEFKRFLKDSKIGYSLDEAHYIHCEVFHHTLMKLHEQTNDSFTVQEAKSIVDVSRKYLILFLELLDRQKYTIRVENERKWVQSNIEAFKQQRNK